jgi:hypothetical protein
MTAVGGDVPVRVASETIHSKVFDDEVVIIDMASGLYFSLRGAAVDVWTMIEACATPAAIAAALVARYDGDAASVAAACERCVGELIELGLALADAAASPGNLQVAPAARAPFVAPAIERYSDMQDLLLLDPVHEVSEAGWPHVAQPSAAAPQRD